MPECNYKIYTSKICNFHKMHSILDITYSDSLQAGSPRKEGKESMSALLRILNATPRKPADAMLSEQSKISQL